MARTLNAAQPKTLSDQSPNALPGNGAMLAALFARVSSKNEPVILPINDCALDNDTDRPAFYCVHALSGAGGTDFQHLAKLIPDVRFLGIQAPPAKMAESDFGAAVGSIARFYADVLDAHQPYGTFFLGGWSAGAVIGLEIAQLLRTRGRKVALLVAIDMAPRNSGAALSPWHPLYLLEWAHNLPGWIVRDAVMMKRSFRQLIWRGLVKAFMLAKAAIAGRHGKILAKVNDLDKFMDVSYFPPHERAFIERLYAAVLSYRPRNYQGNVVAYEATTKPLLDLPQVGRVWSKLAPRSKVVTVKGTHLSILQPGDVDALAVDLGRRIADMWRRLGAPASDD